MNRCSRRLIAFAAASALAAPVAAQSAAPRFTRERSIQPSSAGPQRLPIDTAVLGEAQPMRVAFRGGVRVAERGLSDLRLFDGTGAPVPYLLVLPPPHEPVWLSGRVLPVAATEKTSGFEIDLGAPEPVDRMRVDGIPAPFLKRLTLEGSGDREHWTLLSAEASLFDLPDERLRQTELGFVRGTYRYLRVTWNDANTGRVPLPTTASARRPSTVVPDAAVTVPVRVTRRVSEPGRSRYALTLPASGLPVVAIELQANAGRVFRQATISESRLTGSEAAPVELGRAMLIRVMRGELVTSALQVPVEPPREVELELTIDDGSNPPLDITGATAVLADLPWIYFESPDGSPVTARYGDRRAASPPVYDLEAIRDRIDISAVPVAAWGSERRLTSEPAQTPAGVMTLEAGAPIDTTQFRFAREIQEPGATGLLALPLDAAVLAHSRGPSGRFADVRIVDRQGRQVPYILERRDEPLALELPLTIDVNRTLPAERPARNRSIYVLRLPYSGLPAGTLVVETPVRVFQRRVQIGVDRPPDRTHRTAWFDVLTEQSWKHADEALPSPPLSARIGPLETTDVLLVIDEGDNAPLRLGAARWLAPSYRLRFYGTGGDGLRLAYGRADMSSPRYDLALLAPALMGTAAREVAAAPEPSPGAAATDLMSPRTFWILLTGAMIVLLGLIVRLVRTA